MTGRIITCRKCPRLVEWREEISVTRRRAYKDQEYWGRPVPGFGDIHGRIFVIGLAPGAHGSNRTGRMFTGDSSGDFLYQALYEKGLANQPKTKEINDGLVLLDTFISAVCRCAPPDNKPSNQEIHSCMPYLEAEMALIVNIQVYVALGKIAFDQIQRKFIDRFPEWPKQPFTHGAVITDAVSGVTLIASYHPSRQNTQTGRLTKDMFSNIWDLAIKAVK